MTQEQKDLLLKDLCGRLPYGVMCKCDEIKAQGVLKEISLNYNMCRLYDSFTDEYENCFIFDCRPYLFPMSKTIEEIVTTSNKHLAINVDFFHKNHIDYRGLIEKGLANDATGKNIY